MEVTFFRKEVLIEVLRTVIDQINLATQWPTFAILTSIFIANGPSIFLQFMVIYHSALSHKMSRQFQYSLRVPVSYRKLKSWKLPEKYGPRSPATIPTDFYLGSLEWNNLKVLHTVCNHTIIWICPSVCPFVRLLSTPPFGNRSRPKQQFPSLHSKIFRMMIIIL